MPTNSEFFQKLLGFLIVIASAVALGVTLLFIYNASHPVSRVWIATSAAIALLVGWGMVVRQPHETLNYSQITLGASIFILSTLCDGMEGYFFAAGVGFLSSLFVLAFAIPTIIGNWLAWRNAEGSTAGARSINPIALGAGVFRPTSGDYGQKFREAEETFDNAYFDSEVSYLRNACRATKEWHFNREGASSESLKLLNDSIHQEPRREWDIFVVMVSALPDDLQQPAVIAVVGKDVDKIVVEQDGVTMQTVGFSAKIPASSIRAFVCYRW